MAFGVNRKELNDWKERVGKGEVAFITHYWVDERFPQFKTVTKAGCSDIEKLSRWGKKYGLEEKWIHKRKDGFPHFDLLGDTQLRILKEEGQDDQIRRFLKK
ncbi:hypothetical protein LCM10_02480 [Rossellomorea aquimaris]|uniref:hypothetical protein n=1 Tax=Rossellomorea aquimaris TaxID=189382 RepID=UPI001CD1AABE|nr:hypothetical protein [Rossellomorea aquimaris]MCA1053839.1 hypothetical protein [Rossellomorea aquimaris]